VAGGWIKLCNERLYNLYSSLNIIRLTKQMRMYWDNHATLMEKIRNMAKPQQKNFKRDPLGDLSVDVMLILK